ncbi:MAG TPA: hypothetical protein VD763_12705 [Candidatus Saccharimonadales bacterium]|nr:hypothetical protein [Candidatus Saccharimonadales bacterium]
MAGSLGYCGLDRGRSPLVGDEIRSCWEGRADDPTLAAIDPSDPAAPDLPVTPTRVFPPIRQTPIPLAPRSARLEFVEVGTRPERARRRPTRDAVPDDPRGDAGTTEAGAEIHGRSSDDPRWDLWGDLDR